jgi:tetratricopeptide (TPR) repeat protein
LDEENDLAVLKVDRSNLKFLNLTDSTRVIVGAEVLAIGSPLSLEATATNGIVSALRTIDGTDVVQTSASISPGSSGGPLLNLSGEVVGVTTWSFKNAQNLNFAVAARYIRPLLGSSEKAPFPAAPKEERVVASEYDYSRMKEDQAQMDAVTKRVNAVDTAAEKVYILRGALASKALSLAARAPIEMLLGAEYASLHKSGDALISFEAALTDSLDAHIHIEGLYYRLCDAYVYFRRSYEAVDMCVAAVAEAKTVAPDDPQTNLAGSFTLLGRAYQAAGRVPNAIDAYNSALELKPGNAMANRDLFAIARARGDQGLLRQMRDRLKRENEALFRELFP